MVGKEGVLDSLFSKLVIQTTGFYRTWGWHPNCLGFDKYSQIDIYNSSEHGFSYLKRGLGGVGCMGW